MAAVAVVYWPQRTRGDATETLLLHDTTKKYALAGFRVNERTFCVVELVPAFSDGDDLEDRVKKSTGVDVIGEAVVVSVEQHESRSTLNVSAAAAAAQTTRTDNGSRQKILLRAHLVVPVNEKSGRLMSSVTSCGKSQLSSTPAVVCVDGGANDDQRRDRSSAIRHCNVVFYDARIAAKGCLARCAHTLSHGSAFHAPLTQIGSYFAKRLEQEQAQKRSKTLLTRSGIGGLIEFIAFYSIFQPSTLLMRVSAAVNYAVFAKLPASLPGIGGKSAKDGSRFLELLSFHLHSLARLPSIVRDHYLLSKSRRTTDAEVAEAIEAWNYGCYAAVDAVVGRLLAGFVFQTLVAQLQARGFDAPWSAALQSSWATGAFKFCWRNMGATLQLTLLADALMFFTWNSYWVYQYFTKLNMLQFGLFSSLWKLFVGKKNNVLRKRVDSCEYDVSQLLLGTLLFTILFFIVTTNMVFFVYFGLVRLSIFIMQAALWFPVVCLRTIPVASVLYRWWNPTFFISGVQLEARNELAPPTKTLEIHDVGVGKKRESDADVQQRISEVSTRGIHEDDSETLRDRCPRNAYFQVVPLPSSASSLFSRLRHYIKALSRHYSLGAVLCSWFFGSHISPIPLAILFDRPAAHESDNSGGADSTSSVASSPVSLSSKKNL